MNRIVNPFFLSEMTDKSRKNNNYALSVFLASQKKEKEICNIYLLNSQSFTAQTLNFFNIFSGYFLTSISIHSFYWHCNSCTDVVEP